MATNGRHEYKLHISLGINLILSESSLEKAKSMAREVMSEHGVYHHETVKDLHDRAYLSGKNGYDPPLKNGRPQEYSIQGFELEDIKEVSTNEQK